MERSHKILLVTGVAVAIVTFCICSCCLFSYTLLAAPAGESYNISLNGTCYRDWIAFFNDETNGPGVHCPPSGM